MRIEQMVILTFLNMKTFMDEIVYAPSKAEYLGKNYWSAVYRAVGKYHSEDSFIVSVEATESLHPLSLISDTQISKVIFTEGHNNVFFREDFKYLLEILNPKEIVIFGYSPIITCLDAEVWVHKEKERSLVIRSDLCRLVDAEKDEIDLMGLSNPPKIKIFPKDFL